VPATWLQAEAEAGRVPALHVGTCFICDFAAVEDALLERARCGVARPAASPVASVGPTVT
jgi:hypothetical protein